MEENSIHTLNKKKLIFICKLQIIFVLYFLRSNNIFVDNFDKQKNDNPETKSILKGKQYIDLCLKNQLIKNFKIQFTINPRITVIIPVYNTGDIIISVIRSIQNQNINDIEILLINDFSTDSNYTLKIIENLREEDPRIMLINNKKNMGILYSRSIGVLNAKGEYIMNLDHDDLIFDQDVFDIGYKAALNGNFDIISLMYVISNNYHAQIKEILPYDNKIPHNKIVFQPELSIYTLFKNDEFKYFDYTIWAKFFKNVIYKKAVNTLTYGRYSVFNSYNEDLIGIFVICNLAHSYKYIRKFSVFHRRNAGTASFTAISENRIFDDIFFSEVILDLAKNQFKKYGAIFLENRAKYSSDKNNRYLMNVLHKIKVCKYIEEKYKEKLKIKFFKLFKI